MPDAIIELDIGAPWEPPGPSLRAARRIRRRLRWLAAVAVLALAGGLLSAAGPSRGLDPLYTVDFQVVQVLAGGGRFVLTRYQAGGQPVIETLAARDGAVLWHRGQGAGEEIVAVTDRIVLIQAERADDEAYDGQLTALDAATGAVRWTRAATRIVGLAGGLVIAEDIAWPTEGRGFDTSFGSPDDAGVALPQLPHHERHVGLAEDSGRAVWTADTPPGAVLSVARTDYRQVSGLSELDGNGVLRVRDVGTGAVARTYRLQLSGPVARHAQGAAGQEIVWPAGAGGADVYDRATGRRLWHRAGTNGYDDPYPCLPGRYCIFGDRRTDVLDAGTGAARWRLDGYLAMLGADDRHLLMYRQVVDQFRPDDLAAFAAGDGATRWRRTGWLLSGREAFGLRSPGYFVWRPIDDTAAVIGRLDAGDGTVDVVGRAGEFYGNPQCLATTGRVACLAIGMLYVWRNP
ncbi:PQQ-binding-like beta-propeller repeat protein [Dactylosporangium sp. NPDC051485]|uniref:outer membrane protein assembly factor BamB family protein n=1 Tax=Dactylosporangium sp. NPDC051485 TaxID=3154846 RepID=UPI00343B9A0C